MNALRVILLCAIAGCFAARGVWPVSVRGDDFERDPIKYSQEKPVNCISQLQERLDAGTVKLAYDDHWGYVTAVLRELNVSQTSQTLVFSKTSLQRQRISPVTPRALYFNDDVYIGFCQNGEVVEISAVDPQLGTVFYTLAQEPQEKPKFLRQTDSCLLCHGSSQTNYVPGHLIRSVFPDAGGTPILSSGTYRIDHTSPLDKRWGGWYVTGKHGEQSHLGNLIIRTKHVPDDLDNSQGQNVTNLRSYFRTAAYPTAHSDIVALMVLEHQGPAHNLLTKANFATRQALHYEKALNRDVGEPPTHRWNSTTSRIKSAGDALLKYLLFVEEAPLKGKISGTSGFEDYFRQLGPRDKQGRSLRDFDLERRLFKYPCSYLIYSASFDALPDEVREYVLQRLWDILTEKDQSPQFSHLSSQDRRNIREILLETKANLPDYWHKPVPIEHRKPAESAGSAGLAESPSKLSEE